MKTIIAVIGSDCDIDKDVEGVANSIGKAIAENDCMLVCGGRGGVMVAACRGVKSAGGTTVGILPSVDKSEANEYVDIVIPTGMGYARNALVVLASDVVIAIHGRTGTLSEIALALNYKKPVVVVEGTGGMADSIGKIIDESPLLHHANDKDCVKVALSLVDKRAP